MDKNKNSANRQKEVLKNIVIIGSIGVFITIISLIIAFSYISKNNNKEIQKAKTDKDNEDKKIVDVKTKVITSLCVIKQNLLSNKIMKLYDIENDEYIDVEYDNKTEIKDKYGEIISYTELNIGDIVEIKYDENTLLLTKVVISNKAFEYKEIDDVIIDNENNTISIDNDVYTYDDNLIKLYKGNTFELSKIEPIDKLNILGYKDKVYTINLLETHGYISFINTEKVIDGVLEIDNDKFLSVKELDKVPVSPGIHKVVIKKEGVEPFISQIMISEGEVKKIDLKDVEITMNTLDININVEDYKIYVNEEEKEIIGNTIQLPYGDYDILIKKDGYLDFSQNVSLKEERVRLNIALEEEIRNCVLQIETKPSEADVYVDGDLIDISPIETMVNYGKHEIMIVKDGYNTFLVNIVITEDKKKAWYQFNLTPKTPEVTTEELMDRGDTDSVSSDDEDIDNTLEEDITEE